MVSPEGSGNSPKTFRHECREFSQGSGFTSLGYKSSQNLAKTKRTIRSLCPKVWLRGATQCLDLRFKATAYEPRLGVPSCRNVLDE